MIQRAAIHTDADGLAVVAGDFADGGKLLVATLTGADVAGVDAQFVERFGAIGKFGEQDMTVIVEVADEWHVAARIEQALFNFRHRGCSFRNIYGDADQFRAGLREFQALLRGGGDVHRVGVGHGLHHDGRAAANLDFAHLYANRLVPLLGHDSSIVSNPSNNWIAGARGVNQDSAGG